MLHLEQFSTHCGPSVELAVLRRFVGQRWPWCDGQCACRRERGAVRGTRGAGGRELGVDVAVPPRGPPVVLRPCSSCAAPS